MALWRGKKTPKNGKFKFIQVKTVQMAQTSYFECNDRLQLSRKFLGPNSKYFGFYSNKTPPKWLFRPKTGSKTSESCLYFLRYLEKYLEFSHLVKSSKFSTSSSIRIKQLWLPVWLLLYFKGGGGVKGQKYKLCLSYRVFSHEFNGFRFVKKFQVLFEISRRTRGENDHFQTQNWAKINVNKLK